MNRWRITEFGLALALGAALSVGHAMAGGLRKIWTLPLRNLSGALGSTWNSCGVWGIAFSPDGSRLAIGFGHSSERPEVTRRVVIVSRDDPSRIEMEFDLRVPLFFIQWLTSLGRPALRWSPNSQYLALSSGETKEPWSVVVDLKTGMRCDPGAPRVYFMASGDLLTVKRLPGEALAVAVLSPQCEKIREAVHRGYDVNAISPGGEFLSGDRYDPDGDVKQRFREGVLLDAASMPDIRLKAELGRDFRPLFFLHGGQVGCYSKVSGQIFCRELNETQAITIPVQARYEAIGAGSRVVISEYKKHTMPQGLAKALDLSALWYTFKRRLVWDIDKHETIATYNPATARFRENGFSGIRFFAYSISPDGRYIAEGSEDSVVLYDVQ